MNSALQDSSNIAWKIALVLKSASPQNLLDSYTAERIPIIAQILHATSQLYTHMVAKPKAVENDTTRATEEDAENDKKSGLYRWRNDALQMYGINYRSSPVVVEERDPNVSTWEVEDLRAHAYAGYEGRASICAGDRAPEAPELLNEQTKEETSLLKIFGTSWHTVLIFGSEDIDPILEKVDKYPEDLVKSFTVLRPDSNCSREVGNATVLVDKQGYAHAAYQIEEEGITVVIVRPDLFIGAVVKGAEGVERYFGKVYA